MSRRALAWVLSVPLMVGGVEGGHWLAYRLAYPDPSMRAMVLSGSGHGYLDQAPLFFGVSGALALCAFFARAFRRSHGRAMGVEVSLMPFLLLSPCAFAFQECVERLFVGVWPLNAVLTPTFMPGLLFQLPFAVLAYLVARWLLRAADRLRVFLLERPTPLLVASRSRVLSRFAVVDLPRMRLLAVGYGERGPPVLRSV